MDGQKSLYSCGFSPFRASFPFNCFKSIYGEEAKYHVSVCEERGTKEHDILVEYNDYILIAEVKASKVREPFF